MTGKKINKAGEKSIDQVIVKLGELESNIEKIEKRLASLRKKSVSQTKRLDSIEQRLSIRIKREEILRSTLDMTPQTKRGEELLLDELKKSILRLEEYLLHTSKRIDNILLALKNHREFLLVVNKKLYKIGTRERIKIELDTMGNTLSILAMNGVNFDRSLILDITTLRDMIEEEKIDVGVLRKKMDRLDKKFSSEIGRFDLESIYSKRKDIPGYG